MWNGFVILVLISALNPIPGESSDLTHTFNKGLVSSCISPASSVVRYPSLWHAGGNLLIRWGLYFVIPRKVFGIKEHAQCGLLQSWSSHQFGCCFWLLVNSLLWALVVRPLMPLTYCKTPFSRACAPASLGVWVSVAVLKELVFHKCLLWDVAPCGHRDVCSEPSQHRGQQQLGYMI